MPYYVEAPFGLEEDGRYDFEGQRSTLYQYLRAIDEPLTYFSDYRGLMTVRTAGDPEAAFLYFEPRNIPGGHTFDSRNDFVFASHGRLWSTRGTYWGAEGNSDRRSVILIDGRGQGHQCLPGKTLELVDTAAATFCCGDATMPYSYRAGGTSDAFYDDTPNHSRLKPSPLPWMDLTWGELPGWLKGDKGGDCHSRVVPYNPVESAYRTVGLIKGERPYMVLADDLKKDESTHRYDWLMQVPLDLSLLRSGINKNGVGELLLGDQQGHRLLIYVFSAGEEHAQFEAMMAAAKLESYEWFHHQNSISSARIVLPITSVHARFRIVMMPFKQGEFAPPCEWDGQRETATIRAGDQMDRITFRTVESGRACITLDRNGRQVTIGKASR